MKNILCFGDSNTYGYIPGNRGRYDYEVRWTGILNERIREHGYRVIEEGLVGILASLLLLVIMFRY